MNKVVKIGKQCIGTGHPVYIIAEIGINHNGDINIAKQLIDVAKKAGCDAVKFQKRNPDVCVPEKQKYYTHIFEGPDDMTSHIKSSLLGSSVSFPIKDGKPLLGTWQGVFLCEHRNHAKSRQLVVTVYGD